MASTDFVPEDVRPSPDADRTHRHLSQRVEELERLALAHAKRALAAEERNDRLRAVLLEMVEHGQTTVSKKRIKAALDG